MDGLRQKFDWMAVLPIIILLVTSSFALILNFLNSKNNNVLDDEDERQRPKFHRRRHRHQQLQQHHTTTSHRSQQGNNTNDKQRLSTHRRKNSSRDDFIQQQAYSYYYVRFSGIRQFLSAVKQFILYPISAISFFFSWKEPRSNEHHHKSWHSVPSSKLAQSSSSSSSQKSTMENYYHGAIVVGLDCEMVGGGRGGWKSLLARCSVVTLDHIPRKCNDTSSSCCEQPLIVDATNQQDEKRVGITGQQQQQTGVNRLDDNLIVLYDKYIIPKGKVTDYRTEWSGITKETYLQSQQSPIPIVSFNQCQNEITQLFSSIHGRRVVVVGHALENDFEALEIDHPPSLLRDTAFFRPYMRESRKKMYPRKLSVLTKEELGIEIQQKMQGEPITSQISSRIGHSSVEDAAAALRLYWHKFNEWERSLSYPLSMTQKTISQSYAPLQMYLDGCNLPIGCRGVNFKELLTETADSGTSGVVNKKIGTLSPDTFRLTSRRRDEIHSPNVSTIDWIPAFQSALSPHSIPKFRHISVMFDGAKFGNIIGRDSKGSFGTRTFCVDSSSASDSENMGSLQIHVTNNGDSTDDVLVHITCKTEVGSTNATSVDSKRVVSLDKTIEILSNTNDTETDVLPYYIVIRRKAGGTKTHRKLFDKLHLRRANEGALCLAALTASLKKHSLKIARELLREKSIDKVIECELRDRDELRSIVVTDDVYLTDRLVRENAVLVLSFQQLLHLW